MSIDHVITKRAADGSLTIGELRQFLDEFDKAAGPARSLAGSDGAEVVLGRRNLRPKARVSFSGGIKSITVTVPGGEAER